MINIKLSDLLEARPSRNQLVDGELEDGRYVEFRVGLPRLDNLLQQVVAMANRLGGYIVFGVDERKRKVIGIKEDYYLLMNKVQHAIDNLSSGVTFDLESVVEDDKTVAILEIKEGESTAYYTRKETTPYRQVAYRYTEDDNGIFSISKEVMQYAKVYKYMTLEAFILSLYGQSLRFSEPCTWSDKYERRFYCANYNLPSAKYNPSQLFATCTTIAENSEAAWKVYAHGQALGAHCVQLELNIVELRNQLRSTNYRFEERIVQYVSENKILNLHKKRQPDYKKHFIPFTLDSFLRLLSLKRDAYAYEQELRLFLIPKKGGGQRNHSNKVKPEDIKITWKDVIKKVRVDKNCSEAELVAIKRACFYVGINPNFINYSPTVNTPQPKGFYNNVDFELFDIDNMPGPPKITIY